MSSGYQVEDLANAGFEEDRDEGYPGIAHDFEVMRQQRDLLLAALEDWIETVDRNNVPMEAYFRRNDAMIRAAIAKAAA